MDADEFMEKRAKLVKEGRDRQIPRILGEHVMKLVENGGSLSFEKLQRSLELIANNPGTNEDERKAVLHAFEYLVMTRNPYG